MKKAASFAARVAVAILIAAAVAFAQYWIWQQLNRSAEFIGTNQSIKGFAYNGFQRDQSPLKGSYPTRAELAADLDLLGRRSDGLRTYGVTDMPDLLDLAGERDMLVTAGAWLDANMETNEREIEALIDVARRMRHIERVMVGNEAILRGDLDVNEMIGYLDRVRKAIRKPVSTAEPWHVWLRYPELAKHVDYITVHLLPYHEGLPVEKAVEYAFQRYDEVARAHPRKKIVVGEVGWPSRGPTIDAAVPSLDNQARFVREFLAHPRTARIDYFLMEAIDQPWKVDVEGWAGPYWGMYNADREQKYALDGVVERDPHWSQKASNAAALAFIPMMLAAFFLPGWSIFGRLFLAALIPFLVGSLSSVREIVKESAIYARERAVSLRIWPYLWSKMAIAALFALYHGAVLWAAKVILIDYPGISAGDYATMYVTLVLAVVSGVMWALLISAVTRREEQAMMLIIGVIVVQLVFSGGLVPISDLGPVGAVFASLDSTSWALKALTAASGISTDGCVGDLAACNMPGIPGLATPQERALAYKGIDEQFSDLFGATVFVCWAWMVGLIAVTAVVVYWLQKRKDTL